MPGKHSRTAPSVTEQSTATFISWLIMQTSSGRRHLCGYCLESLTVRVTTAIASFDVAQLIAVTESGRSYHLQGPPGANVDALHAWREWAHRNGLPPWREVSAAVWADHQLARGAATSAEQGRSAADGPLSKSG